MLEPNIPLRDMKHILNLLERNCGIAGEWK